MLGRCRQDSKGAVQGSHHRHPAAFAAHPALPAPLLAGPGAPAACYGGTRPPTDTQTDKSEPRSMLVLECGDLPESLMGMHC